MSEIESSRNERCAELEAHWVEILEGKADEALYEHLAQCDACRDARHEVERAKLLAADAGGDFVVPEDLAGRVTRALSPDDPAGAEPEKTVTQPLPAAGEPEKNGAPPGPRPPLPRAWIAAGAVALAAAIPLYVRWRNHDVASDEVDARARVEQLSSVEGKGGLSACAPSGKPCSTLEHGDGVPMGSRVKTDFATQAVLAFADGSRLSVDRGSELVLRGKDGARAELVRGTFVSEATKNPLSFALEQGTLRVERGKVAIRASSDHSVVEVASGRATLRDRDGNQSVVRAGEQGRLGDGAPLVLAAPMLGDALAWSERLDPDQKDELGPRGLGELRAQKPGTQSEIKGAVQLAFHAVRARIAGMLARTEVEEVFENTTNDVLEGIYRFPLPADAKIERLALEVDGKLVEGAFVDRDRAAAIWRGAIVNAAPQVKPLIRDEIVWVPGPWRDPALLEWQRGGRFELRIFPIPRRGSRRVVLAYTQVVPAAGETRRYSYPLAHDPSGTTRVGRFEMDVQVRGNDEAYGVRPAGYDLAKNRADDAARFTLNREGFVPSGDLTIEYALPDRRSEISAFAYRSTDAAPPVAKAPASAGGPAAADVGSEPYFALALRPRLPRSADAARRAFAIVVDSSRSMFGESYARARRLAARLVRELDADDRVVVLACDSDCQQAPGRAFEPGAEAESDVARFLERIAPDGASDPTRAVELAYKALSEFGDREARIVYIGDGTPTVGPIRPAHLEAAVARSLPAERARVTSVAVGAESDLDSLSALSRGGGGVVVPYVPGQGIAEATFAVLGAAYGHALRDVTVTLPDGLYAVAPSRLDAIPAGGEALVVARMRAPEVEGDIVLRGKLGGAPFERRYPLRARASESKGNAFVPRLYAALRIADLERDGGAEAKRDALALSTAFNVASRYTSLLVLESQAMFRAFGLDNARRAPEWSADEEADASATEVEVAREQAEDNKGQDLLDRDDGAGMGALGKGRSMSKPMSPYAAAPEPTSEAPQKPMARAPAAKSAGAPSGLESRSEAEKKAPVRQIEESGPLLMTDLPPPPPSRRRMIPMRRIWERAGDVVTTRLVAKSATSSAIADAERAASRDENRREPTRKLYALLALSGDLERAGRVVERWTERDPLDIDALTARADLAARRGERDTAIRLLGSVVDARPGDVSAQRRLERLERWSGNAARGCRHLVAAAELRQNDARLLADALRCSRTGGDELSSEQLLAAAADGTRRQAEAFLREPANDDSALRGDVRIEASWSGSDDLDVALIDADGQRISWLGAPTRAVISARDVAQPGREGLALRGAKPGEYTIELVRAGGDDPVSGELTISVAGTTRRVPFRLAGTRAAVAIAVIRMEPRLVPL